MSKSKPRKPHGPVRAGGAPRQAASGGGGKKNMNQLLAQAQQMQAELLARQESIKDETVEVTVGGGMVTVVANGRQEIESIRIDPDAVDPDDVEMLQDLVLAGVNEALREIKLKSEEVISEATGGMDLGAMLGGQGLGDLLG
jgi:DNA-binding YbaB/EbfC family protein